MYTKDDVRKFLYPDKGDNVSKINGFPVMLESTAKWIRGYDPEFVECAPAYEDNDLAVVVDWLSLVTDDTDTSSLLGLLETHLNAGAVE